MLVFDIVLLYFILGIMNCFKFVQYMYVLYLVGYLLMMWWFGVCLDDVYFNIFFFGWVKYVWLSFYLLFLVEVMVFVYNYVCFDVNVFMQVMDIYYVLIFCVLLIVWCMFIQVDFMCLMYFFCELVGVGELFNFEVIDWVCDVWGGIICDGFGQIEMIVCIGNLLGQMVKVGLMGCLLFGYFVVLFDFVMGEVVDGEGEIVFDLFELLFGFMVGYYDDFDKIVELCMGGYYYIGDIVVCDVEGYFIYVGCLDDVFKVFDYKILLFELELVLFEYDFVIEVVVILSFDLMCLVVLKVYVCFILDVGVVEFEVVCVIFFYVYDWLLLYLWVWIIEFVLELLKIILGKICWVELCVCEVVCVVVGDELGQYWDCDYC